MFPNSLSFLDESSRTLRSLVEYSTLSVHHSVSHSDSSIFSSVRVINLTFFLLDIIMTTILHLFDKVLLHLNFIFQRFFLQFQCTVCSFKPRILSLINIFMDEKILISNRSSTTSLRLVKGVTNGTKVDEPESQSV